MENEIAVMSLHEKDFEKMDLQKDSLKQDLKKVNSFDASTTTQVQ